jgi:hypothetical protein
MGRSGDRASSLEVPMMQVKTGVEREIETETEDDAGW